jgi:hypothetical protein
MITLCMPIGQQPPALAALKVVTSLSAAAKLTAALATPRALCSGPCTVRAQQRRWHLVGGRRCLAGFIRFVICSRHSPQAEVWSHLSKWQSGSTAGGEAGSIAGFLRVLTQPWRTRHRCWLRWRVLFTLLEGFCKGRQAKWNTAAQKSHNWRSTTRTHTHLPQHRTFTVAPRILFGHQFTPHSDGFVILLPQGGWCSSALEPYKMKVSSSDPGVYLTSSSMLLLG